MAFNSGHQEESGAAASHHSGANRRGSPADYANEIMHQLAIRSSQGKVFVSWDFKLLMLKSNDAILFRCFLNISNMICILT